MGKLTNYNEVATLQKNRKNEIAKEIDAIKNKQQQSLVALIADNLTLHLKLTDVKINQRYRGEPVVEIFEANDDRRNWSIAQAYITSSWENLDASTKRYYIDYSANSTSGHSKKDDNFDELHLKVETINVLQTVVETLQELKDEYVDFLQSYEKEITVLRDEARKLDKEIQILTDEAIKSNEAYFIAKLEKGYTVGNRVCIYTGYGDDR